MWSWTSLNSIAEKAQQQLDAAAKNLKDLGAKANDIATKFIEEQKQEFKQLEQNSELQSRKKTRRSKAMKCGCPPWHINDENGSDHNENNDNAANDKNANDNNNNNSSNDNNSNSNNNNNNNNNNNDNVNNIDNNSNSNNSHANDKSLQEELKLRILKICEDEQNFLIEAPTSKSVFEFHIDTALPYANAALKQDPNLQKTRFLLVPKKNNGKLPFFFFFLPFLSLNHFHTSLSTNQKKKKDL
ncbi:hypothetical protein RFI_22879 [Reticulomyxa filosa]|uniref:Uncharacterized protein n=1 Tax=Reticulomyxa filosa TaxID=46433 RepID=X6MM30_RETFI|nr:hypothetical protein RFI_22879 [Reticulomyxa filosa]|eukprot:ETO14492.1 hypothetical protein RFI_22879 [Reticulomyxa filosa]